MQHATSFEDIDKEPTPVPPGMFACPVCGETYSNKAAACDCRDSHFDGLEDD